MTKIRTLRRHWESWLRWPYSVAAFVACIAAGITRTTWIIVVACVMIGVSAVISFAYAVAIGRLLSNARKRRREAREQWAAQRAASLRGRGTL